MRALRFLVLLPLLVSSGCVHVHETSATAGMDRIRNHLAAQLHCEALELKENSRDSFSGAGKNQTGEFTIEVTRQGQKIVFHGIYTGQAQGTFSGSASWNKSFNSAFGFHKSSESTQVSLSTP